MKKYGKVLIVDAAEGALAGLRLLLKDYFSEIDCERNPNLIPSYLGRGVYDAYILDMNFNSGRHNGNEGIFWMNKIFETDPGAAVILTTSNGNVDTAVRAIKAGATDLIQKPWSDDKMRGAILSVRKSGRSGSHVATNKAVDRRKPRILSIIGSSEPIKKILLQMSKVAATDANVLITGENGTGKELVARAIHNQSNRIGEAFVSVDMGSISGSLFESELFGHKKGAFTDAGEDRPGRFESADGGTLFLDEIGNLPLSLQPKLLSALQNREIVRVGTNRHVPVDIRLITATNMPLERMVREGRFRGDLLYRMNTITIHVPPLRQRKPDIKPLFDHFKEKYETKYSKPVLVVDAAVFDKLISWHWPGNVRELEHAVEKAVIMSESGCLGPEDFAFNLNKGIVIAGEPECYNLAKNEMRIINQAIERCRGNLSQASRILGITRKTLYNKISKYGI